MPNWGFRASVSIVVKRKFSFFMLGFELKLAALMTEVTCFMLW
jgi:hypothetical protein